MLHLRARARAALLTENASLSSFGLRLHDKCAGHLLVTVSAVLRTENGKCPRLGSHELDGNGCVARLGTRHGFLDSEGLDFNAMRAVSRSHEQPHTIAFGHLDGRRLEVKATCDDLEHPRLIVRARWFLWGYAG